MAGFRSVNLCRLFTSPKNCSWLFLVSPESSYLDVGLAVAAAVIGAVIGGVFAAILAIALVRKSWRHR